MRPESGGVQVNWLDVITHAGAALSALGVGALVGRHWLAKPPAPRENWKRVADLRRAELAAKAREKQ